MPLLLKGEYVVRRSFTASGVLVEKGSRVVDPPYLNGMALVEANYLMPAPVPKVDGERQRAKKRVGK